MLFDRQVMKRFLAALLAWGLLLFAFSGILSIRGILKYQALPTDPSPLFMFAQRLAGEAGSVLMLAAPVGALATFLGLRRSGILASFLVAGLSPARLRVILLTLAALTTLLHAAGAEVGVAYGYEPPERSTLWRAGGLWVWSPDRAHDVTDGPHFLFTRRDLDVSRVTTSHELDAELATPPPRRKVTVSAAPSRFLAVGVATPMRISALSRLCFPSLLVLLSAYVVLLQREGGAWRLLLTLPLLGMLLALGLTWVFVRLANGGAAGYAAAAGYWLSAAVVIGLLDRTFVRRGLRLSR